MNQETREGIADAFDAAYGLIERGEYNYICVALGNSGHPYASQAKTVISRRMRTRTSNYTLGQWLMTYHYKWFTKTRPNMRTYRLTWLGMLSKEFRAESKAS